jgi:hypothetical protein
LKLDQETAEAILRLTNNRDFATFLHWFDSALVTFTQGAVMGFDENHSSDVLRGRAQGLSILKHEMEKAPEVAGRIQKIS